MKSATHHPDANARARTLRWAMLYLWVAAFVAPPAAFANDGDGPPAISVNGHAELSAPPDLARLSVSVVSKDQDARSAASENAKRGGQVLEALEAAVGESGSVRTESYTVTPDYRWDEGEQTLIGYTAHTNIAAEVRNLDQVGEVINSALAAGADSVSNLQFVLEDDTQLRARALALAAQRAKGKAETIAGALGVETRGVISVQEGIVARPSPRIHRAAERMSAASAAPPVVPGPVRVLADVTLRVAISN